MLAIEVEYLLGRAVATDANQRDRAEWPPHPTRLFSALVDALADVALDSTELHAKCEAALRWLETLPAPEIRASVDADVSVRTLVRYFVPINDQSVSKEVRAAPLVDQRARQERFFPAVTPADPIVTFAWPHADADERQWSALQALVRRVPYLGHSSSAVRVACRRTAEAPTLVPALSGGILLRVPGPGRLERLVSVHVLRSKSTVAQPPRGREVRYRSPDPAMAHGPLGSARVFEMTGGSFGLEDAATLVYRFRAAVLSYLGRSSAEILTGHQADGARSTRPHIAFTTLANLDHRHADGSVKGLAVLLPRDIDDEDVLLLESASSRVRALHFGQRGSVGIRPIVGDESSLRSLQFDRYCRPSRTWASVTPVVFGVHPKPKKGLTEEHALMKDIECLGLPRPVALSIQDVAFVRGAPNARGFGRGSIASVRGRVARHVRLEFDATISGPLLLGAGRHMGFGLLLPETP